MRVDSPCSHLLYKLTSSDLSQDLLESVVEGPEADEIYEMYFSGLETTSSIRAVDLKTLDDEGDEEGYEALRGMVMTE